MISELSADAVTFTYGKQRHPVLMEWDGSFPAGSTTAIMGPSGAGKSSLLFLLGLMLKPDSGRIAIDGDEVGDMSDARRSHLRSHRYGFIFQDSCLDPRRTVLDNIGQGAVFRSEHRDQWVDRAHELMESLGVSVPATRRPGQVSGGQAQRIALCRALLHNPDIILADEPTGNLDEQSADVVVGELKRRAEAGAVVVVVTHSRDVMNACDHLVQLRPADH